MLRVFNNLLVDENVLDGRGEISVTASVRSRLLHKLSIDGGRSRSCCNFGRLLLIFKFMIAPSRLMSVESKYLKTFKMLALPCSTERA